MRNSKYFSIAGIILFLFSSFISARDFRVNMMPNGAKNGCLNCHVTSFGGDERNAFGKAVEARVSPGGTQQFWDATLAKLDSDGDGSTNGLELQDPNGTWKPGQTNPGTASLVTLPGDPASKPAATAIADLKMPVTYKLEQNYPNPFNPTTTIKFSIPNSGFTELSVFDITGREVSSLVNNNLTAGSYAVEFKAGELASGIYFYRIQSKDFVDTKKFVLLK
jgi:hypothetical protein